MINLKRILAVILLSLLTNSSQIQTHTEEKQLQSVAKFGNKETSEAESNAFNYSFDVNKLSVLKLSTTTSSQKGVSLKFQEQ